MMNPKGIAAIAIVGAIILLVVFLPVNQGVPPPIQDSSIISDEASLGIPSNEDPVTILENASVSVQSDVDSPVVSDFVDLRSETMNEGIDYYIDENGTKHYILKASDTPGVGG